MPCVVILEDDDDLRHTLSKAFKVLGASKCLPLASVAEMQEKANEVLKSNLAVLDVNLGAGLPTGIDAYNWLVGSGYSGRIIILTGHALAHPLVSAAAQLPGVAVYEKPLGIKEFAKILKDLA